VSDGFDIISDLLIFLYEFSSHNIWVYLPIDTGLSRL